MFYIGRTLSAVDAIIYMMVDSHESDAFGPYFEKAHFFNIQNKQRLYFTHSAPNQ